MKSYHTNLGAGIDGIVLTECDEPRPGPRQILMRVRAASLNARELSIQREAQHSDTLDRSTRMRHAAVKRELRAAYYLV
jgi:NADPH:quinone reductase-like Zn-dependent oxidoreductase